VEAAVLAPNGLCLLDRPDGVPLGLGFGGEPADDSRGAWLPVLGGAGLPPEAEVLLSLALAHGRPLELQTTVACMIVAQQTATMADHASRTMAVLVVTQARVLTRV